MIVLRGDATKQPSGRREYSARERSACASHSNEDVSSPRRSCWRPASVWPARGSPPQQGAAATGNWPQFRGPNRDGKSADTNLLKQWDADGPALAWKVSGLGTGYSSLSIGGDRLFTMGDIEGSQYVIALSAADGKQLWKAKVGPIWQDGYPGPRATPTVDGALVYSLGTEGDLVCLEAATGKERWRKNLPRDFGGQVMSDWKFSRVAAGRRRSRRRDPWRVECRNRRAEQDHRRDDLAGQGPDRR